MQINNMSFPYGQQGLHRSQEKLDQASQKVAQASTQTLSQPSTNKATGLHGSLIQDGLIEAKSSELEAQANAKVIDASDKTIGRLIDITV
ncbi:hypothetical protein C0J08_15695 [Marinomonas sp. CT5]|uniref:hypothetical protein n=1 Tax=Marinomonas sp. CT5 TaxID=2066133 RepID=UPI001851B88A|nr:hypothetical protein [Marinomonas sp. CT5]NVK73615.1 hypothetical protein [Oceanospirillaceae bacterium]QUX96752.1 hypothetical protein C0J08_15695 [Marinomonas sp. CT5]